MEHKNTNKDIGTKLAKKLMNQIDDSGERSSFWMVSCLSKLGNARPQMRIDCLMDIIKDEMPKAYKQYQDYLRNT